MKLATLYLYHLPLLPPPTCCSYLPSPTCLLLPASFYLPPSTRLLPPASTSLPPPNLSLPACPLPCTYSYLLPKMGTTKLEISGALTLAL